MISKPEVPSTIMDLREAIVRLEVCIVEGFKNQRKRMFIVMLVFSALIVAAIKLL